MYGIQFPLLTFQQHTRNSVRKTLHLVQNVLHLSYLADIHMLSYLIPKNTTVSIIRWNDDFIHKWKVLKVESCISGNKYVEYHPKLRPAIKILQTGKMVAHQDRLHLKRYGH